MIMAKMNLTSLDVLTDEVFGKRGTPKRDAMEKRLQEEVNAYFVGEAIRKMRQAQNLTQEECEERAKEALTHVGLDESFYAKSPFELSGGQKRRVAIAGVLAMNPKVLILDEPTAGLDPQGRDEILDQIASLHETRGITIILVSHSMEDIAKYVDRIIVMNHGEKVYDDAPKKVFAHYKELEKIGLAAPQITYIMHALAEKGMEVDTSATTVEEARGSIMKALEKRGAL